MGERNIDYLGEWHTHSQRIPVPSSIDRAEWHKLATEHMRTSTLLTVVVGTKALHVELIESSYPEVLAPV